MIYLYTSLKKLQKGFLLIMEINRKEIGLRIRKIRKDNKLTYKNFGDLILHAAPGTVSNWESGIYVPNSQRLEQIAKLGNTSVDYLLWGDADTHIENILLDLSKKVNFNMDKFKDELVSRVLLNKVPYGDTVELIKILLDIDSSLFSVFKEHNIFTEFDINENDFSPLELSVASVYQSYYKPMITDLFQRELSIENFSEKQAHQVILRTLDMLIHASPEHIAIINNIIKNISWISSRNIVDYSLDAQSETASFGGRKISFTPPNRTKADMKTDFKTLETSVLLDLNTLFEEIVLDKIK